MLASEYHWSKRDILENVYLDELLDYQQLIKERQVGHYKILLGIAQNPHIPDEEDRRVLWDMLDASLDDYTQIQTVKLPELDRSGFDGLKIAMAPNPRIVIK